MLGGATMRDLSVYYCKKCGYYAYYQLPKNAICPTCDCKMTIIDMRYQDFMDLSYEERDRLISRLIIEASSSLVHRICATISRSMSLSFFNL